MASTFSGGWTTEELATFCLELATGIFSLSALFCRLCGGVFLVSAIKETATLFLFELFCQENKDVANNKAGNNSLAFITISL